MKFFNEYGGKIERFSTTEREVFTRPVDPEERAKNREAYGEKLEAQLEEEQTRLETAEDDERELCLRNIQAIKDEIERFNKFVNEDTTV